MTVGCVKTFFPRLHDILVQIQIRSRLMNYLTPQTFDVRAIITPHWEEKIPHRGMTERTLKTSSMEGHFPPKDVYQRSSSIKNCLPSKIVLHQRLYPFKSVFHQSSSFLPE